MAKGNTVGARAWPGGNRGPIFRRFLVLWWLGILVGTALLAGGCATIKNYPDRSIDPWNELTGYLCYLKLDKMWEKYYGIPPFVKMNESEKKAYRNDIIYAHLLAMDMNFEQFQQNLVREGALVEVGTDWAGIGLDAAAALVPLASTSRILAQIATGIGGAKASMQKGLFYKKTLEVLLLAMQARRKEVLSSIIEKMNFDTDNYQLGAAIKDLEEYFRAGTIPQALTDLATTSGEKIQEQRKEIRALQTGGALDAASNLLRNFWRPDNKVNVDNQNALLIWMDKNGVHQPNQKATVDYISYFLRASEYALHRQQAVKDLQLKK